MQGVLSRAILRRPPFRRPEDFYGVVSAFQQYLRPKRGIAKKVHPHNPRHHDWSTD